jgi:hypothetical protein
VLVLRRASGTSPGNWSAAVMTSSPPWISMVRWRRAALTNMCIYLPVRWSIQRADRRAAEWGLTSPPDTISVVRAQATFSLRGPRSARWCVEFWLSNDRGGRYSLGQVAKQAGAPSQFECYRSAPFPAFQTPWRILDPLGHGLSSQWEADSTVVVN